MEDAQSPLEPSFLEKPYVNLLFKGVMSVYEEWTRGNIEVALNEACILVVILPTDIKEMLWERRKKIKEDLAWAYRRPGVDWYTRQQNRNRAAKRVAHFHLEPFMDEIVRLLDEKGWLERGALRPRAKGHGRLRI